MSLVARLTLILAAWTLPIAWVVAALVLRPSDGTIVWSPAFSSGASWDDGLTVTQTYGRTSFSEDETITAVDDRPIADWLAGEVAADRSVGDKVSYTVVAFDGGLRTEFQRTVTLVRFPIAAAVVEDLPVVVAAALLMLAGGVAFLLRPGVLAARAFLGAMTLAPAGLASTRWGIGAVDLVGGGHWRHVGTELVCVAGLGLAVLCAVSWRVQPGWLAAHRWPAAAAVVLPLTGYAAWAGVRSLVATGAELTRSLLSIAVPSLAVAAPAVLVALVVGYRRAGTREARLATRLALLVLVAGLAGRALLGDVPAWVTGRPVLPWELLLLLLAPPVLAGVVVSLVGYRLDDVEPPVRRAVIQAAVAALVGAAFVAVAGTVGSATDVEVGSVLAGGAVALVVLPLAVVVQRGVRRLVYGDRDLPRAVVSELRRLDVSAAPAEALAESLDLLARRLRLAHATIEVPGTPEAPGTAAALATVGEAGGRPSVTVDLRAGGARIGTLSLEVAADRDAFGRSDRLLLEDVGAQIGGLVQAVLANVELSRSRQEIVTAREEERRRLRRDLHDGLGPSLATLAMRLESAQDLLDTDPAQAAALVETLADLARDEIAEVRRLVDGLRPAALDQLGLVSALRQQAAQHRLTAARHDLVWSVVGEGDVEPLPAAVEVAAYRIVIEAITNAVKHSGARSATVTLRRADGHLVVRVEDDGSGLAPDAPAGVGLFSMRERAQEVGGICSVTSDARGTVVDARLPLGPDGG